MIVAETSERVSLSIPRYFGNYIAHKVIGQGSTCVVIEATDCSSGKDYAVKVMSSSNLRDQNLMTKVTREILILSNLSHDNVVRVHDIIHANDLIFLVTENCSGGNIITWITDGRTADKQILKRLFHDVLIGLQYLHRRGIAHNDIKPDNIIVDASGRAKLADFGFAKTKTFAGDDEKNGTLMYAAPELFHPGRYDTQKADMWSLGILLYVMATQRFPFNGKHRRQIICQVRRGELQFPSRIDKEVERLIRRLTKVNPNERPTIDALLEDSFFDDIRPPSLLKLATVGPIGAERDLVCEAL
jgi:serine/threonine protein kinase